MALASVVSAEQVVGEAAALATIGRKWEKNWQKGCNTAAINYLSNVA